ncbi:MAG TPA: DNA polymerase III subunit beta [Candidatus Binatia bacterium]|nr:DNA polymerase III subunit beta [Candidatus Binatia bacterium]
MNITIGSEDFLRILGRTQGVVDRRHAMAILANLVIEAGADGLAVVATDLEVSLRQTCPARTSEPGSIALSARKLFEIVRESSSPEITVRSLENNWVGVSYGRSNFRLAGIDPADHPGMPSGGPNGADAPSFELDAAELAEMISKTIFSVSHDDTRSNLAGVHLDGGAKKGVLRMVATDGHRLAMIDRKTKGGALKDGVILPRKGLSEMLKLLPEATGPVTLKVSASEAILDIPGCTLSMRLVEGTFPDYKQVVPKESPNLLQVDRDALLQTVRRVSLLSSERARGIRFGVSPGRLEISANDPDVGEAREDLEVDYGGVTLEIGFNARYLLEVLQVLPEGSKVEVGLGDQLSPGVIRGSDSSYSYVVMPMRI